ncbi:MAG: M23 family metallopeptidase [Rhodoferax sp.]|nr:M23 family metallopeptidase [Rhodoferax sp.]
MINSLANAKNAFLTLASQTLKQHPKRITAVMAALMLGGGGGAFAVASFAPDASDLPVREILESVQALPLNVASDDLNSQSFNLFRSDVTRSSDTADTLLKRLGVDDTAAAAFLRTDATARQLLGRSGRNVTAETSDNNALLKLSARWSSDTGANFQRLVLEKTAQGFQSRIETAPLTTSSRLASGTIQSTLFAATDDARIPDAVAIQLTEIFSSNIDFHRALRKGDRFSIVYEALEGDGEPLRTGRVLSAEFVNGGKTFQAMWFQDSVAGGAQAADVRGKGGYYTLDGQSLRRAFLASPMEFSRVTSGFKMRFHPILQIMRAHQGVDYAAPTGTAVRSVGDGVVEFAGVQNGYGNVIFLKHRNNYTTVYAHLSRINVRKGENVTQGENIGAVGSTGWATGPHLHFEYRINGVYHDPLTIARENETVPVSTAAKAAFARLASENRTALSAAASIQQTSAQ